MMFYLFTLDLNFYYMVHLSLLHFSLSPSNTHWSFSNQQKGLVGRKKTLINELNKVTI